MFRTVILAMLGSGFTRVPNFGCRVENRMLTEPLP
jgi:hypothetical protein